MKLIACHVENYGRLHDFDMDFNDGVNIIRQDNGWGKSTLAFFLKAMFYGLDGDRKRTAAESERKKFRPWQGGTFGGRLLFEAGGKRYLVSRTFGDTAAKDTFDLRDGTSNLPSTDFDSDLGKGIFKIDSVSFYRTVFFGHNICIAGSTDDIHAKISNLADNTDDINNFQSADKLLSAQINRLTPDRSTGSLYRRRDELAELRRKALEGKALEDQIILRENERTENERRKEAGTKRRAELEELQKNAVRFQQTLFLRSERNRLESAKTDAASALARSQSLLPAIIPPIEEISRLQQAADEMKKHRDLMAAYELTPENREELAKLRKAFGDQPPAQAELDDTFLKERIYRDDIHRYEKTRLSPSEQALFDTLTTQFSGDGADLDNAFVMWDQRCQKSGALNTKRMTLNAMKAAAKSEQADRRRLSLLPVAAGILLLVCALPLIPVSLTAGAILAGAGAVLAAVGILLYLRKRETFTRESETDDMKKLKTEIENDQSFITEADELIVRFLKAHGLEFEAAQVSLMLGKVSGDRQTYERLALRKEQTERIARDGHLEEKAVMFREYLRQYGFDASDDGEESFSEGLYQISAKAGKYRDLLGKKRKFESAESDYLEAKQQIHAFFVQYRLPEGNDTKADLASVRASVEAYLACKTALDKAAQELAAFEKENPVIPSESTEVGLPSLDQITEEINATNASNEELSDAITRLSGELSALYQQVDGWEKDCAKLEELSLLQEKEQKRYDRLVKARDHLRLAKERMTAQFTDPITRGFARYYEKLTGSSAETFRVDAEANVTNEEYGVQRDVSLLSTGYRDLAGICLRLALTDAMYPEEKPPVILDDPFAFLDDGKIAASKKFLQEAGKNYQIIYFTCSVSRE